MGNINHQELTHSQWAETGGRSAHEQDAREHYKVQSMGLEWDVIIHPGDDRGSYEAFCTPLEFCYTIKDSREECLTLIPDIIRCYCIGVVSSGRVVEDLQVRFGLDRAVCRKIEADVRPEVEELLLQKRKKADESWIWRAMLEDQSNETEPGVVAKRGGGTSPDHALHVEDSGDNMYKSEK